MNFRCFYQLLLGCFLSFAAHATTPEIALFHWATGTSAACAIPLGQAPVRFFQKPQLHLPEQFQDSLTPYLQKNINRFPSLVGVTSPIALFYIGSGGFNGAFVVRLADEPQASVTLPGSKKKLTIHGAIAKFPHHQNLSNEMTAEDLEIYSRRDESMFEAARADLLEDAKQKQQKLEGIQLAQTHFMYNTDSTVAAILQERLSGKTSDQILKADFDFYRGLVFETPKFNRDTITEDQRRFLLWATLLLKEAHNTAEMDAIYAQLKQVQMPVGSQFKPNADLKEVIEMFSEEPIVQRITDLLLRLKAWDKNSRRFNRANMELRASGLTLGSRAPWVNPWAPRSSPETIVHNIDADPKNYKFYKNPETNMLSLKILDL